MPRRLAAARATWHGQRVRTAPLTETAIQRATAVLRAALNDCKALKVNSAAGIELPGAEAQAGRVEAAKQDRPVAPERRGVAPGAR